MILILLFAVSLLPASEADAQLWSNILHPSRATDYTQAGIPGGIPKRTDICQTLNPPKTAAEINAAIQACSNDGSTGGKVVKLGPGVFNLTSSVKWVSGGVAKNVTLRGSGADQTTLRAVDPFSSSCPYGAVVCVADAVWCCSVWSNATVANWTAGFAQGTTQITLSSTSGLAIGSLLFLDQASAPVSDFPLYVPFPTESATYASVTPAQNTCNESRNSAGRCVAEMHRVTGISGNTVTITPPLAYQAWNTHGTATDQPQAFWIANSAQWIPYRSGVEDLTVDNQATSGIGYGLIQFLGTIEGWAKGVRVINGVNASIQVKMSSQIEVRDSYAYFTKSPSTCLVGGTQYGYDIEYSGFVKIENNIAQQLCTSFISSACMMCVFGYNFSTGDLGVGGPNGSFGWGMFMGHAGGTHNILTEGNISNAWAPDHQVAHGANAGFFVNFRNYFSGQQWPGATAFGAPAWHEGYNRMSSWIGNVLGNPASGGWAYESSFRPYGTFTTITSAIFSIGHGCRDWNVGCTVPDDAITYASLMRWGNCENVTNMCRFVSSEVPSPGTSPYLQFVPTSQALPNSFYLSSKPSWFGSMAWPAIGPDITGGFDSTGHARSIPARDCYLNVMHGSTNGSGAVLSFNADTCYRGGGDTTAPVAPIGLGVK